MEERFRGNFRKQNFVSGAERASITWPKYVRIAESDNNRQLQEAVKISLLPLYWRFLGMDWHTQVLSRQKRMGTCICYSLGHLYSAFISFFECIRYLIMSDESFEIEVAQGLWTMNFPKTRSKNWREENTDRKWDRNLWKTEAWTGFPIQPVGLFEIRLHPRHSWGSYCCNPVSNQSSKNTRKGSNS